MEASELDLPRPKITYAHGGGCVYSPEPEVVLKPRAAVVAMDQYARERLMNITALLDSGISCNLGADLDIGPDADMDSLFGDVTQGSNSTCCTAETPSGPDASIWPATLPSSGLTGDECAPGSRRDDTPSTSTPQSFSGRLDKTPSMLSGPSQLEKAVFSHVTNAISDNYWSRRQDCLRQQGEEAQQEYERKLKSRSQSPLAIEHALQGKNQIGAEHHAAKRNDSVSMAMDQSTPATLARRAIHAAAEREAWALLHAEKERLQASLATSSLAKGLYFKRCNGQWVNAVDDVLVVGSRGDRNGDEGGRVFCGTGVRDLQGDEDVCGEKVMEKGKAAAKATATKDDQLGSVHGNHHPSQGHDEEEAEADSSTPSMTMSSTTETTSISSISLASPVPSSRSSSSLARPLTTTPCNTVDCPEEYESVDTSKAGYGYALLHHGDATQSLVIPSSSALASSSSSPSSPSSSSPLHFPSAAAGRARLSHDTPSFEYLVLQGREQLVRSGQCTEEDLCMTSWGHNRLSRTL
ncbi:uncharacterized protein PV07_08200 [Cladophialophora immunda]|uniref:Uncharacterized protein n=1 Tax=Cladophialophora immunda TaxID=569365 RepID=A0A0D1ZKP9_9EURO|nr:uncharacterized protein PV07_08200 [Cladophialophora immunda]KIW28546.1 hypothetical protein PV07_08200 [Cladophialophora immunda]